MNSKKDSIATILALLSQPLFCDNVILRYNILYIHTVHLYRYLIKYYNIYMFKIREQTPFFEQKAW